MNFHLCPISTWCPHGFGAVWLSVCIYCSSPLVILILWWPVHNLQLSCLIGLTGLPLGFLLEHSSRFLNTVNHLWPSSEPLSICLFMAGTKLLKPNALFFFCITIFDTALIDYYFFKFVEFTFRRSHNVFNSLFCLCTVNLAFSKVQFYGYW